MIPIIEIKEGQVYKFKPNTERQQRLGGDIYAFVTFVNNRQVYKMSNEGIKYAEAVHYKAIHAKDDGTYTILNGLERLMQLDEFRQSVIHTKKCDAIKLMLFL